MDGKREVRLEPGWLRLLGDEFEQPYMRALSSFLRERRCAGATVFPPGPELFNAFWYTPPERVSVVILGQDPYHGPGQAHGLCFSVRPQVPLPPSLRNIYQELEADLGIAPAVHGSLVAWARRGVLLLNSVLSVEQGRAGAHQGKGWERFTDRVVSLLDAEERGLVFMLWGSYAQKKGAQIDGRRHCVLRAPHPSPLSAHRGFIGCRHFSRANDWLAARGAAPVDWQLPSLAEAERLAAQPPSLQSPFEG
ncbi:uracil-DNA glycosylase [Pseudohaliea sp.]|uniref:uracil-DNA glycosylase n=1 Tax=Pseudohaliea sp. TaxID=2740289 RepID=UPI0032EEFBD4